MRYVPPLLPGSGDIRTHWTRVSPYLISNWILFFSGECFCGKRDADKKVNIIIFILLFDSWEVTHFSVDCHNMLSPLSCKYSKIWTCLRSGLQKTWLLLRNQKLNILILILLFYQRPAFRSLPLRKTCPKTIFTQRHRIYGVGVEWKANLE